jgi:AcrR family transcriptional regulator
LLDGINSKESTWRGVGVKGKGAALLKNKRSRPVRISAKRRRLRSTADNLERILRAAAHEFMSSGFTGATTAAIARNAEVTEAQLFRYFSSKIELFQESVFKPLNQHFLDFTSSRLTDGAPAESLRDKSHRYISELQQFLNQHSKLLMSLAVAQAYAAGSFDGIDEIDSLNTYFERGASMMASRMVGKPKVDPNLMVRVSFAAVLGCILFKDWILPAGLAGDQEISAAIKAFIMDGINANADTDR